MSNIVDFPVPDRPITEDQLDKLHSQAFRDFKGRLCDCVRMARIARELAANAKDADEDIVFAIGHTFAMLETLKVDYYAAYHGEKLLDVIRHAKLTPRIASSADVTPKAPLPMTMRCRLIGCARWLSRLARREGLWAGRALHSPSRPQPRAMGQRSWRR